MPLLLVPWLLAVSAAAPSPPAVQLERVRYALEAAEQVARSVSVDLPEPCVVLRNEDQWVLGCPEPYEGLSPTQALFGGRPVYYSDKPMSVPGHYWPYESVAGKFAGKSHLLVGATGDGGRREWPLIVMPDLETLARDHVDYPADTPTEKWVSIFVHEAIHLAQDRSGNYARSWANDACPVSADRLAELVSRMPSFREKRRCPRRAVPLGRPSRVA